MLSTIILIMLGLTVLFLILAVEKDNAVYAILSMILGGVSTLFWGDGWESKASEFVVENADATTVENIGSWSTTTHTYEPYTASAWIPALFSLVAFLVFVYVVLDKFRSGAT